MTDRRLYLDLDGVMADFDAHFPALFGVDHRELLDDDMWGIINAHPSYFRDMPVCDGAKEFFAWLSAYGDPIILTACPKSNYAHVARQKREWVREHLCENATVLPVMGGRNKPLFMHAAGDILIDDFERNIDAWQDEGGVGILHKDFRATRSAVSSVLGGRTSSDWITWNGGECPVAAETRVEVKFRCGMTSYTHAAGTWGWWRYGGTHDIIAYRVVGPHDDQHNHHHRGD